MTSHELAHLPRRLVKVGGSLFLRPQLPAQLDHWIARQEAELHTIWFPGGGQLADVVREWDARFSLDDAALQPTLRVLQAGGELLAALRRIDPPAPPARLVQFLDQHSAPSEVVLDPVPFVAVIPPETARRCRIDSWEATSDTLAALAARQLDCRELVLLKACPIRRPMPPLETLTEQGIVDPIFPRAAAGIERVRVERLQDATGEREHGSECDRRT